MKQKIQDRIKWLRQKSAVMCDPSGPDYTSNQLLRGRVQGEIGGLQWVLDNVIAE